MLEIMLNGITSDKLARVKGRYCGMLSESGKLIYYIVPAIHELLY